MESKDKLEQFVIDNRGDFGPEKGFPDIWSGIEKREFTKSNSTIKIWLARAASVVVIFSIAYLFFVLTGKPTLEQTGQIAVDQVLNELKEADEYYSAIITERKSELFSLTENSPSIREDVNRDFADLDAILIELRDDLQDNADNAEVIEAMMQQYRLKLEILEDMLEQVKTTQNRNQNEKGISI